MRTRPASMRSAPSFALIVLSLLVSASAPGALVSCERPPVWGVHPAASSFGNLTPSSNVSVQTIGPTGSILPGDRLGYRYQVATSVFDPASGAITVWFPATQATFAAAPEPIVVDEAARNITLNGSGFWGANATLALPLALNITELRVGGTALFTTLQAAPMVLAPRGSLSLEVQWQWVLLRADGAASNSSWFPTPPTALVPAQFAGVASLTPRAVEPGGSLVLCLEGPIDGRAFALQAATATDNVVFASTEYVAASNVSPSCEPLEVPQSTPVGPGLLHVWNVIGGGVDLLLYSMHFRVGNLTAPSNGGFPWMTEVNLFALAILLAVATVCVYLWRAAPRLPK
jgi:hypothetical protein